MSAASACPPVPPLSLSSLDDVTDDVTTITSRRGKQGDVSAFTDSGIVDDGSRSGDATGRQMVSSDRAKMKNRVSGDVDPDDVFTVQRKRRKSRKIKRSESLTSVINPSTSRSILKRSSASDLYNSQNVHRDGIQTERLPRLSLTRKISFKENASEPPTPGTLTERRKTVSFGYSPRDLRPDVDPVDSGRRRSSGVRQYPEKAKGPVRRRESMMNMLRTELMKTNKLKLPNRPGPEDEKVLRKQKSSDEILWSGRKDSKPPLQKRQSMPILTRKDSARSQNSDDDDVFMSAFDRRKLTLLTSLEKMGVKLPKRPPKLSNEEAVVLKRAAQGQRHGSLTSRTVLSNFDVKPVKKPVSHSPEEKLDDVTRSKLQQIFDTLTKEDASLHPASNSTTSSASSDSSVFTRMGNGESKVKALPGLVGRKRHSLTEKDLAGSTTSVFMARLRRRKGNRQTPGTLHIVTARAHFSPCLSHVTNSQSMANILQRANTDERVNRSALRNSTAPELALQNTSNTHTQTTESANVSSGPQHWTRGSSHCSNPVVKVVANHKIRTESIANCHHSQGLKDDQAVPRTSEELPQTSSDQLYGHNLRYSRGSLQYSTCTKPAVPSVDKRRSVPCGDSGQVFNVHRTSSEPQNGGVQRASSLSTGLFQRPKKSGHHYFTRWVLAATNKAKVALHTDCTFTLTSGMVGSSASALNRLGKRRRRYQVCRLCLSWAGINNSMSSSFFLSGLLSAHWQPIRATRHQLGPSQEGDSRPMDASKPIHNLYALPRSRSARGCTYVLHLHRRVAYSSSNETRQPVPELGEVRVLAVEGMESPLHSAILEYHHTVEVTLDGQGKDGLLFDITEYKADTEARLSKEAIRILKKRPADRTKDEIHYVQVALWNYKSLAEYPVHMQKMIAERAWFESYGAKRVIVREGHLPMCFYFVLSGSALVSVMDLDKGVAKTVMYYNRGDSFGELAIMNATRRQSTVISKDSIQLLVLTDTDFVEVFMSGGLKNPDDPFLNSLSYLDGWPLEKLGDNPKKANYSYFKRGTVLVPDSHNNDWIIIVKSGSVSLLKKLKPIDARKAMAQRAKQAFADKLQELMDEEESKGGVTHEDRVEDAFQQRQEQLEQMGHLARFYALPQIFVETNDTYNEMKRQHDEFTELHGMSTLHARELAATAMSEQLHDQQLSRGVSSVSLERQGTGSSLDPKKLSSLVKKGPYMSKTRHGEGSTAEENSGTLDSRKNTTLSAMFRGSTPSETIDRKKVTKVLPPPMFVNVQTLTKGMVFGLSDLFFDNQPCMTLISNGAECISISKKLFMEHASHAFITRIREDIYPYPSEEDLQENLESQIVWDFHRRQVVTHIMQDIKWSRADKNDARVNVTPALGY